MVRKESPERAQRATILDKMTCFTKLLEGLRPTAREVGEVRGQFTTIKSNEMKPMNLQEEVKKLEEQESAINVACPMEDEASWVITCKGDHEEEITQFDGETVKKMMINEISTFLSTIDDVQISPEGFDSEVQGPCHVHGSDSERIVEQNVVVPVLQIRKEVGEVTELIPEERISECIVEEITHVAHTTTNP